MWLWHTHTHTHTQNVFFSSRDQGDLFVPVIWNEIDISPVCKKYQVYIYVQTIHWQHSLMSCVIARYPHSVLNEPQRNPSVHNLSFSYFFLDCSVSHCHHISHLSSFSKIYNLLSKTEHLACLWWIFHDIAEYSCKDNTIDSKVNCMIMCVYEMAQRDVKSLTPNNCHA